MSITKQRVLPKTVRAVVPLAVLLGCGYLLSTKITLDTVMALPAQLAHITWQAWVASVALTVISLWAVGRYDGVAHAHFATRIPNHQARWTGSMAIALAQTLGFGLFTGAVARWRILTDLSLPKAFQISAFVSLSFVISWAMVTALASIVLKGPNWAFWPSVGVLLAAPVFAWLLFRFPAFEFKRLSRRFDGVRLQFPTLRSAGALLLWAKMDTFAAAAAFFVLLPTDVAPESAIGLAGFIPVFLLALGAALISNTPGGVGPFELALFTMLPQIPVDALLTSIVAFRLVYYAGPAACVLLALFIPFGAKPRQGPYPIPNLSDAPNSELGVIKQNGGYILADAKSAIAVWPTGQTLTALCDPIVGDAQTAIIALTAEARTTGRMPFIYKCNSKTALIARATGWAVMHISDDALLTPALFNLDTPARRGLRRKLRAAQKSGVMIQSATNPPWTQMAHVDAAWQTAHGSARGGTMGRFCPDYLSDHFIALAFCDDDLVAFATFQRCKYEWCLDVMRHTGRMPDGTMHALVTHAVQAAASAQIARVSLAATPACPDPSRAMFRWAAKIAVTRAGGPGLRQFKSAFAPSWQPRYAAAQNQPSLLFGLADIAREVHHPVQIEPAFPRAAIHNFHNVDENYELASQHAS
ncbi:Phosphatidylglycerol lysyltransferase [Ascidiaceihabitans donghaensis]|uniref:Phosphatidylglycerol lysyltransferase n=1 Tax=Ascidiaceihabitans donghaensis TaxID=1510460 RepID=A0A2R8BDM0_9RHOB|nr:phosphatidylglycerol lysyltransferase domain-containing protein [Ascidiaceihabitans donghaensis]SPH21112.1 Phosphatidylglycerol lysyltransferase [Ascidiaceihabitans donghaensis]